MKRSITNIIIRCEFIDLLDRLEKINYDYVDINELNNFVYIDPKNDNSYKISKIINNRETYLFQFKKTNNEFINIPNAKFHPKVEYDFNIDLVNKIFKKIDEYQDIELHTIINMDINNIEVNKKNKSLLRKIFGC